MTFSKRFPDTGKSRRRWLENFLAWPVDGMHWAWRREAMQFLDDNMRSIDAADSIVLSGHSRGGAVALYVAAFLCLWGKPITVRVTGVPRCWFGKQGRINAQDLTNMHVVISYKARGDFITWLPPWFRRQESTVIGPRRFPSWKAHKPSYYRMYGG